MAINYQILCYVPNLIGYFRLLLILATFYLMETLPAVSMSLYTANAILDGIDGYAARRLGQCSAFGAWFDVVVDNLGRSVLWSRYKYGILISNVEWITFVCNHSLGSEWKTDLWDNTLASAPVHVKKVMANGILAISGLHVLPIWLFGMDNGIFHFHLSIIPISMQVAGLIVLLCGRALCLSVELWCIWAHVKCLISRKAA